MNTKRQLSKRFRIKALALITLGAIFLLPHVFDFLAPGLVESLAVNLRLPSGLAGFAFLIFGCLYQARPLWDQKEQKG